MPAEAGGGYYVPEMNSADKNQEESGGHLRRKAARAQLVLYLLMLVFMTLPILLAWLAGALPV